MTHHTSVTRVVTHVVCVGLAVHPASDGDKVSNKAGDAALEDSVIGEDNILIVGLRVVCL